MTMLLKKISIVTLAIGMLAGVTHAQEGSAEGLVAYSGPHGQDRICLDLS